MITYNDNYTHDLEFGNMGEKSIARILELDYTKAEVKTERGDYDNENSWVNTAFVAIEIECRDKPSGLKHTKADYWIHNFEINGTILNTFIAPVPVLKELIDAIPEAKNGSRGRRIVYGGDNKASKLVLVPTEYLFSPRYLAKAHKTLYGKYFTTKCCVCNIEVLYLDKHLDIPEYCSDICKDKNEEANGIYSLPW